MATSRFSPAATVASQIRRGALGVNGGGTQGRMNQMHKGVGLNQNSGGMNARGSGAKPPGPPVRRATPQIAMQSFSGPRTFTHRPTNTVRRTSAWTEHLRKMGALGGAQRPTVATPQPPAPPGPPAHPTAPIDYTAQAGYMQGMANLNLEAGGNRAQLQSQLAQNERLYGRARGEAKDAYSDSVIRDNAMQAARGIHSSGMREERNADRFQEFDQILAGIEEQYGSVASGRLQQALQQLAEWEAVQKQSIEAEAKVAYQEAYPAAPLAPAPPPPPAPAPPAPSPRPTSPAPRMTKQQAVERFNGPRTFRHAPTNTVRRTAAWTNFLRQNGLL